MEHIAESLVTTLQELTREEQLAVQRFAEELKNRERKLSPTQSSQTLSEAAFASVWENPEDDVYDAV